MNKQIMDLVESIQECIQILIASSEEIAKELQSGNETKAMQQLAQYLENFMCLVEAIAAIRSTGSDYFNAVNELDLRDKLSEMEQAFISKDYVLLADIVEYEINELLSTLETQC
jgi:acetylornithine deacetylase/succinyl-diaminopimelate desuccinylase-like protein